MSDPSTDSSPAGQQHTIPALLRSVVAEHGQREFIVSDAGRLTYAEVDEHSTQLAAQLLESGVGKGTRVGVLFPSDAHFVVAWLAVVRLGASAVPINTLATPGELRDMIRFSDVQHIVATPKYLRHDYVLKLQHALPELATASVRSGEALGLIDAPFLRAVWFDCDEPPPWAHPLALLPRATEARVRAAEDTVTPADPIGIVFTSGSTGTPKAIVHTHGTLLRESVKMLDAWQYTPTDRIFTTMPFFWVGGLSWVLLTTMRAGAAVVTSSDSSTEAILDILEREQVTFAQLWPHASRALAADPSFARRSLSIRGGSLYEAWLGDSDPELLANGLGMTETGGPHTIGQHRLVDPQFRGSFGRLMAGVEHRLIDVDTGEVLDFGQPGELLVRGETVMVGMHRREPHTVFDADGWYHTGDYCTIRDGHLFFHGRIDDQMKVSGVNVSPAEIEAVIVSLPGVSQAFVVGVPDAERGAIVAAALVGDPDVIIDPDNVITAIRERLASYKVPRIVVMMSSDTIPMKSSGKVDRAALAELLATHPRR